MAPSIGHYSSVFKVAEVLEKNGHRVVFTTSLHTDAFVKNKGFKTCKLITHAFGLDIDLKNPNESSDSKVIIKNRMSYKVYEDRKKEIKRIFEIVKPQIVFIDSFISTDFVPLYSLVKKDNVKVFFIQTMLSSTFSWTMPHYNSSLSPNNKVKIFLENFQRYLRHLNNYFVDKVRFLGYDDRTTILKKIKEEQIAKEYKLVWNFPSGCTFKNIIEIFVSPKELEFRLESLKKSNKIYLGLSIISKYSSSGPSIILGKKNSPNEKLLYVSFGTLSSHKLETIKSFLDKLNTVLTEFPTIKAIVSAGGNNQLYAYSSKWKFFKMYLFVQQTEILSKSSYFLTHGGLNSLKEAIYYEVPMLVYPLEGDQLGNAQKVKFHQLGIYGDVYKDSVHAIRNALEYLIKENNGFKTRLAEFSKTIKENYNFEEILLDTINSTLLS
ncbi:MAG: glycosyltransferase [Cyclobacteriaceae bacterium]|nr:glycosyltransferase [Cyclobacteriaceae bacterium]